MKAAVEIYINMVVLIMITASCVFFISSSLRNAQARNFHSTITAKIEASYGSEKVIQDSIKKAEEKGYTLNVTPVCLYEDKNYYYVELRYEYEIPFIGKKRESKIEGYAR